MNQKKLLEILSKHGLFFQRYTLLVGHLACVALIVIDFWHTSVRLDSLKKTGYISGSSHINPGLVPVFIVLGTMGLEFLLIQVLLKPWGKQSLSTVRVLWTFMIFTPWSFISLIGLIFLSSMRQTLVFVAHFLWLAIVEVFLVAYAAMAIQNKIER
jgi:hypothetical protein